MKIDSLLQKLDVREVSVSFDNILDNSKAASGGERDLKFLKYLYDNQLLVHQEMILKRKSPDIIEEYYLERYKKMKMESDRHFLCRTVVQDELKQLGFDTLSGLSMGDMNILRENSNYDIVLTDFSAIMDVGLTAARNFYKGLTDGRVKYYFITTYFDDYMDDIIFGCFKRSNDNDFINAVKDYQDGFKEYIPGLESDIPEIYLQ